MCACVCKSEGCASTKLYVWETLQGGAESLPGNACGRLSDVLGFVFNSQLS